MINQMSRFDFEDFDYETAYNYLNELIEEITSLDELENVKKEMEKYKLKTSYIQKHISNLKTSIKMEHRIKKLQEKEIRQQQKENRRFLFWNLVSSLFGGTEASKNTDSGLMPWEQDEINKGNYEPYQFEEEELEEDDYYYEDD